MRNLVLAFVLLPVFGLAQSGPGGIGSDDGTSSLALWQDANSLTFSDAGTTPTREGEKIAQWNDLSGSGNHSTQTASLYQPAWHEAVINGFPAVYLSGHYLESILSINPANTDFSFLSVFIESGSGNRSLISQQDGTGVGRSLFYMNNTRLLSFIDGTKQNSDPLIYAPNNWTIAGNSYDAYDPTLTLPSSTQTFYLNGNTSNVRSGFQGESATGNWIIGANKGGSGQFLHGHLAEVIIYSTLLNKAQIIILQNYLAAKYGLTLASNDVYNEDEVAGGNYDYEVAGIGRVDAANVHPDAKGSGVVHILNPTNLENDEFLLWGHDNGLQDAVQITDIPSPLEARFERVWRASEVNTSGTAVDVGAVDIQFDLTGLGPVTAADLRLLVDSDNDGLFADEIPIAGATPVEGSIYQFAGVTALANNLRFTLGTTNIAQTPLPIELRNFTASTLYHDRVQLEWQTVSETNNEFFTIERSPNGNEWEMIISLKGAGNSSTISYYSAIDEYPHSGISYYRLKQTAVEGQVTYSDIRRVKTQGSLYAPVEIYPNPSKSKIKITAAAAELERIRIYNNTGQDITNLSTILGAPKQGSLVIDIGNLDPGLYLVKTKTTTSKVHKQ